MKTMRSFSRREYRSQERSPRGVDSTTPGIIPRGSKNSCDSFLHFGSRGSNTLLILAPLFGYNGFTPLCIPHTTIRATYVIAQRWPLVQTYCAGLPASAGLVQL